MGAGQAAARRRLRAGDGAADRKGRAGETGRVGEETDRQPRGGGGGGGGGPPPPGLDVSAASLLAEAEESLREGRAEDALPTALRALETLRQAAGGETTTTALPALNLVAEINLELGNAPSAREHFLQAVTLDPAGRIPSPLGGGGGASKFLWLAQLSESGGQDSVSWFERGATILRREIATEGEGQAEQKRKELAGALCGMIEVYMTDLSWDPCAESRCAALIAEALLVAPLSGSAEPLQTLASIRISQSRIADAQTALRDSMALWSGGGDDDDDVGEGPAVPEFATRVSLARLLMEVRMEEEALAVLERLVLEDDGSVEAWYLGGWCLYLLGGRRRGADGEQGMEGMEGADGGQGMGGVDGEQGMEGMDGDEDEDQDQGNLHTQSLVSSREWLRQSLKLYEMVEYEDERLRDHAMELVEELDAIIGETGEDEVDVEEEEEEEWDGFADDDDDDNNNEEEQEDEEMD